MSGVIETGVYCILNTLNGKRYIGSAASGFSHRWAVHRNHLRHGKHHSLHLQRAWDRDGEAAFEFAILERCPPADCIRREQFFITQFQTADPKTGYNIAPLAGSTLGTKLSEGQKTKLRAALANPITRERMSNSAKKRIASEETRKKMGLAHHGHSVSEATKEKMRIAGRRHSREISIRAIATWTGRKHSMTSRDKISLARKGKKASVETRMRMSLSHKQRYALNRWIISNLGMNPSEIDRNIAA